MKNQNWVIRAKRGDFEGLSHKFNIDPVVARIMVNRDIKEEEFDQMKEIAVEILKSMSQQYKESMKEILEYSAMRNEFDLKIKTALNISQCMVENIRKQVLEEIY